MTNLVAHQLTHLTTFHVHNTVTIRGYKPCRQFMPLRLNTCSSIGISRKASPGALPYCISANTRVRSTSTSDASTPHHSFEWPYSPPPIKKDTRVVPNSLRKTIDAHRKVNEHFLRKIARKHPGSPENSTSDLVTLQTVKVQTDLDHQPDTVGSDGAPSMVRRIATIGVGRRDEHGRQIVREYKGAVFRKGARWGWIGEQPPKETAPYLKMLTEQEKRAVHLTAQERVALEIEAFVRYMTSTPEEQAVTAALFTELKGVIEAVLSKSTAQLIGSRSSGLAMPLSDIDINVSEIGQSPGSSLPLTAKSRNEIKRNSEQTLLKIRHGLAAQAPDFTVTEHILKARIPLLNGFHVPTGIKFQIQSGPENLQNDYILSILPEFPSTRPLFFVLKHALDMRDLSDGSTGGTGSYTLLIMILASLKFNQYKRPRLERSCSVDLIDFLDFWSNHDCRHTAVTIEPFLDFVPKWHPENLEGLPSNPNHQKASFLAKFPSATETDFSDRRWVSRANARAPWLLCLQEPLEPRNDVGSHVILIKHVQTLFSSMSKQLQASMFAYELLSPQFRLTYPGNQNRGVMGYMLNGDYSEFESEREAVKRFGSNRTHS